jgi:hypothetical protein
MRFIHLCCYDKYNGKKTGSYQTFTEIKEFISHKEGRIELEILNMEKVHWKILGLMGEKYENIISLITLTC